MFFFLIILPKGHITLKLTKVIIIHILVVQERKEMGPIFKPFGLKHLSKSI